MKNFTAFCCSICLLFSLTVRAQDIIKEREHSPLKESLRPSGLSRPDRHNDDEFFKNPGDGKFSHRSPDRDRQLPDFQSHPNNDKSDISDEDWVRHYASGLASPSDDYASDMAIDQWGNIYIMGYNGMYPDCDYATIKYNTNGDSLWCKRYNGSGNGDDRATSIAVDLSGNVYVTGYSGMWPDYDYATIKYNTDGDSLWCQRYDGPRNSDDEATSIAVDLSGNVYVTGYSYGSSTDDDYATIKYNTNGDSLWCKRYNGPRNGDDRAISIAVDSTGNVYVTGYSGMHPDYDYATIKYNTNGDSLWCRRYNGPGNYLDKLWSIAVDTSGNVYVTGYSYGLGTYDDYATIKYNTNGDSLWCKRYDGPGNSDDEATSLAVDLSGNVYVTGYSYGSGTSSDYATIKYNTNGDSLWCKRYDGPGNSDDEATSLAVDLSGNVYVTGYSGMYPRYDYATIKYNTNGDSLWCKRYNGPGNFYDEATSIAVDLSGNVYVTGYSYGSGTDDDYATIKYNTNGDSLWCKRYNGPGNSYDYATSIAIDARGNVYVTGYSYSSSTSSDYTTIKYNTNGDLLWCKRYNGPGDSLDYATSITVDASGNVYVTGWSYGPGTDYDYATIKYNANGDSLWCKRYNGPGDSIDYATSIVADASGNVYVTGRSYGSGTDYDYTTIKYNTNGDSLWCKRYNGPGNYIDIATSLAVDASGNVYVTGYGEGSDYYYDYATIKYNTNGDSLWCKRYNGPDNSDDQARSIAVDALGNVYVTGYSYGSGTSSDYATLKYNTDGDSLWCKRYNGSGYSYDYATSMAIDGSGNVYVTGYSNGSSASYDYATIKYNTNGDSLWCKTYNGPANSSDNPTSIVADTLGNVYVTGYSSVGSWSIYTTIKYASTPDVGVSEQIDIKPTSFKLEQNYPNPFNPATVFKYHLPINCIVKLTVYDILGRIVTRLVDEAQNAGFKSVEWNASGLASGVYFYRLDAVGVSDTKNTFVHVGKMLLVR